MRLKVRTGKDFYAGLVFILIAAFFIILARGYPMGTPRRMGPGMFPIVLGCILVLLGLILVFKDISLGSEALKIGSLRPLVFVLAAVVAFGCLIQPLGLVLATLGLIVLSCLGGWKFRIHEVLIIFVGLALISAVIFVYILGLPFKVWPR